MAVDVPGVRVEISQLDEMWPFVVSPEHPAARTAAACLRDVFGKDPYYLSEGGSIGAVASFDRVLGLLGVTGEEETIEQRPSQIIGYLVRVAVLLFAAVEASRLLGFSVLADLVAQFLLFAAQVLLGLVIFAIGLYLANLAARIIQSSDADQANLLALAARVSILALAGAMAMSQMGLASDIINLAFGIVLGAVALAVALAFGLGGREVAARQLDEWKRKWDGN